MLQAPIEGYEDAIVVPPINANNFERRECLSIIESKSEVKYSRSRVTDVRANANAPLSSSSHSNSFDLQQIVAALEDKLDIRMNRFEKSLNKMKNSFITPTAPLKAVTEIWLPADQTIAIINKREIDMKMKIKIKWIKRRVIMVYDEDDDK
nr:hypothetical protein [Tanacetum cinerariifolium]